MSNYQIPASKVRFSIDPVAVSDLEVGEATLLGMRDVLQNFTDQYGPFISMTSYSSMYPYYEMVGITFNETVINLLTSALAVMIVLFLLLPPGPSFLAVISVLLADVCILAWIPLTGLNLNAITSTCMVMSVGIAVDFSSHVTHAFVETDGKGKTGGERASLAVTRMGRSLTTSAFTTFLSVFMLSTVNVPSNRTFFTMMTGVVIYGMAFGLLFLPILLSFFNPKYVEPVELNSPMTPLPPGEEAVLLEKTRSRGVRRHHRHTKQENVKDKERLKGEVIVKSESENEGVVKSESKKAMKHEEPVAEAISDSSSDFEDARSYDSSGSKLLREVEMVALDPLPVDEASVEYQSSDLRETSEVRLVPETKESVKNTSVVSTSTSIKRVDPSALKKFHRPRDIVKQEAISDGDSEDEPEPEPPKDSVSESNSKEGLWSLVRSFL
ncbi:hypothetical protein JH06_1300 [Blastocystis sp. subtype 4]|uniref:hypothetical protein n=1 Tax=Blastocystis sp. subtype 4 TaxID=944170 RepID=UPI00071214E9|nr:hypothetical protein JH06_1300 [Blastocystis sp. subtype 4]KNB45028.1 hypothetical protein JH06_1300 [Blastocystis sp. subtype 4]|eukprot:XP_014528471.1 hypothetical protein JH06_1300 [Blastocystis sp. subtype 4]